MSRPARRVPVAALLGLAAAVAGPGCVRASKDVREAVLATYPARLAPRGGVTMRTDYAALVEGAVGLRFDGTVPCTRRLIEEYSVTTHTHRASTRTGWIVYGVTAGLALGAVGTGLGLGFDGTKRDNLAADATLSYGLYLLVATGAVLGAQALLVGDRTKTAGPFSRVRSEAVTECGPGPVRGAVARVALEGAWVEARTGDDGAARFTPFDLVDAYVPARGDAVFAVKLRHPGLGEQAFDFGLSAGVLRAAADRFLVVRGLRPPAAGEAAPDAGVAAAALAALETTVALEAEAGGPARAGERVRLRVTVHNGGTSTPDDLRFVTAATVPGWKGRWLYVAPPAPGASVETSALLPASELRTGAAVAVRVAPVIGGGGRGREVETSATLEAPRAEVPAAA
ncbi:MAG TPA: hypothetical protein VG389_15210, partial [Myxococcota bacterium]|nr:hypothetical protein [Myxococcota bacterium]